MLFSFTSVLIRVIIQLWISIYKFMSTFMYVYTNQGNKLHLIAVNYLIFCYCGQKMLYVVSSLKNMVVKIKVS